MRCSVLILFFLLLNTGRAEAQKNFATSDGYWAGYIYSLPAQQCWDYNYRINGDTTINMVTYHKLYSDDIYFGGFRNEGNKVYYLNDNDNNPYPTFAFKTDSEVLLYDFGLAVGDQYIYSTDPDGLPYTAEVSAISSITKNGKTLKQWSWTYNIGASFHVLTDWIEGIGSLQSGFFPTYPLTESDYGLKTYEEDNILYEFDTHSANCWLSTENSRENTGFKVYPNPSDGQYTLTFTTALPASKVSLHQSDGKLVKEIIPQEMNIPLDLTAYPKGIYLLTLYNETSLTHVKLIRD